ncbi:MAG: triose-phosphate isomerase, partial [Clostridia bacterium]
EPIWAIGTGKTATSEQAGEICALIRAVIRTKYGARCARSVTIQYGGSMNAKNASELLSQLDVDGGLIGGASLKADDFANYTDYYGWLRACTCRCGQCNSRRGYSEYRQNI